MIAPWSNEEATMAADLWRAGHSASQIAKTLRGRTRNAVIGRLHRMGVISADSRRETVHVSGARRGKDKAQRRGGEGSRARRLPPLVKAKMDLSLVESPLARPWQERRMGQCAFPLGDRASLKSCCNPVMGGEGVGRHYCADHYPHMVAARQPGRASA